MKGMMAGLRGVLKTEEEGERKMDEGDEGDEGGRESGMKVEAGSVLDEGGGGRARESGMKAERASVSDEGEGAGDEGDGG